MEAWRKELYLAHHGIKGQRWGVRKGPPYPLDASDHTTSEKKAGWQDSLGKPRKTDGDKTESRKGVSSDTKRKLATAAAIGALAVIGAAAVSNPKVRELAANGLKATNNALLDIANDPYAIKKGRL